MKMKDSDDGMSKAQHYLNNIQQYRSALVPIGALELLAQHYGPINTNRDNCIRLLEGMTKQH